MRRTQLASQTDMAIGMPSNAPQEVRTATKPWVTWTILLTILLVAAAIRWRVLDVPLERDEGE